MRVIMVVVKVAVGVFLFFLGVAIFFAATKEFEKDSWKVPQTKVAAKKKAPAPTVVPAKKGGGQWTVSDTHDSMTGRDGVTLQVFARNTQQDKFGRPISASLYLQCANSRTDVFVNTDTFVSTHSVPVMHRIDAGAPATKQWRVSTDYEALFAPQAIGLIKSMKDGTEFRVRFTPHGESSVEFLFPIAGLDWHLGEFRKACAW